MKLIRKYFFPQRIFADLCDLSQHLLKTDKFETVFFDFDNTLGMDRASYPLPETIPLINKLKERHIKVVIVSNGKKSRLCKFATDFGIELISEAKKPSPRMLEKFIRSYKINKATCVMVGDQLLTDILAGNRCGITTYLLKPLCKKEIVRVKLKRPLEKLIIFCGGKKHFRALEGKQSDRL